MDVAVDTEASNATVRDIVNAHMCEHLSFLFENEHIVARRRQVDLGQDLGPLHVLGLHIAFRAESTFDGSSGSLVAGEVAGVDIETADRACETKLDNAPRKHRKHYYCILLLLALSLHTSHS